MLTESIEAALVAAKYELIQDEEPYYREVPSLEGVWAIGTTLGECRQNLREVLEGWVVLRLRRELPIADTSYGGVPY